MTASASRSNGVGSIIDESVTRPADFCSHQPESIVAQKLTNIAQKLRGRYVNFDKFIWLTNYRYPTIYLVVSGEA